MDGWPGYWAGLPPMHYATHCVGPCLALTRGETPSTSSCFGSGTDPRGADPPSTARRSPSRRATSRSTRVDVTARIYRSLFDTARQYRESFDVYGSEEELRVAADRRRGARAAHGQEARAGDSRSGSRCPTSPTCCPRRSGAFTTKGVYDDGEDSTCRSCRAAATAARIRTWSTSSSRPW